ncbi:DNA topoisomerase 2-binding protein 1-like [Neocloeon triangulifer]|uniref:DNA topoisomerase 2-binding protein 1-like n=1 Tax=Neocloeon triangulifer TaxID=2078957 RepID=UPI00286ED632|nr:DNA topoisomerase 2-binding protein 1-like [Neocloeon triangulifer]
MPRKKACHSANLVKRLVSLIQQENITSWTEVLSNDFIKKLLGSDSRSKSGGHQGGKVENTIVRIKSNISNPTCHVHAAVAAILGPKPPNPPKHSKPKDLQAEDEFDGDESVSSDTSSTSSSMDEETGKDSDSPKSNGADSDSGAEEDASGRPVPLPGDGFVNEEDVEEELAQPMAALGNVKLKIKDLTKREAASVRHKAESMGAKFVDGDADYIIGPFKTQVSNLKQVTWFWLEECGEKGQTVPIKFYHRPILLCPKKPLKGVVVAISTYDGKERVFLSQLAIELGAVYQGVFSKKPAPEMNIIASTHLICPTPKGPKFEAATKWRLPVVTRDWLLHCSESNCRLSEEPFLLTRPTAPSAPSCSASVPSASTSSIQKGNPDLSMPIDPPPNNHVFKTPSSSATPALAQGNNPIDIMCISRLSLTSFRTEVAKLDPTHKNSSPKNVPSGEDQAHYKQEKEEPAAERPVPHFMLTGIAETDLNHIQRVVNSLNGKISATKMFNPEATHLVTNAPSRSIKLIAAIAAGLWILHPEYLLESHRAGIFTSEEDFEWGNPKAAGFLEPQIKDDPLAQELAAACYRWRKTTADKKGAFKDFKAILLGAPQNTAALKRIILAGDGEVVPYDEENFGGVTHCFIDFNEVNMDLSALRSANVPCHSPLYLSDYLIKNPPPES